MSVIIPFKNSPLDLSASFAKLSQSSYITHLSVKPPTTFARQGLVISLIFDVSGSMGTDACKVGDDATNYHTRLDLLKVVAELFVGMLGPEDLLSLIVFSDNASILLQPTRMNLEGKGIAITTIKSIRAGGSTNLWNSLELTHRIMSRPEYMECLRYGIMLTDGEESYPANNPNGTVGAFMALPRSFVLNVFGFGSQVNSKTLSDLASSSGGRFTNIADFTTLATSSINAMAIGLATCCNDVPVTVTYSNGTTTIHHTSLIQSGQNRDIVFSSSDVPISASLPMMTEIKFTEGLSLEAEIRYYLLKAIKEALHSNGASQTFATVYSKYSGSTAGQDVNECNPVSGELIKACADRITWAKWGQHYCLAYKQALENDHRMNFKELGQARLGGSDFERYKDMGDAVFAKIPKPVPTGTSTFAPTYCGYGGGYSIPQVRAVASVAASNDPTQAGGCWAPDSLILLSSGLRKPIKDIEPNDRVWTQTGYALVDYTFALGTYQPLQNMCNIGGLLLTWYHPIFIDGVWCNPCDMAPVQALKVPVVYNLLLRGGHSIVDIDGILTVCLGHGLKEKGVEHAFFGSRSAILDAVKDNPGYNSRRIVFKNLLSTRDPLTNVITGWYEGDTS